MTKNKKGNYIKWAFISLNLLALIILIFLVNSVFELSLKIKNKIRNLENGNLLEKQEKTPLFPQIYSSDPILGNLDAPITLFIFSSFSCPHCAEAASILNELENLYKDKIKIVWKDFPLPSLPESQKAAEAARCAGKQGKFWPYHDLLFSNQSNLSSELYPALAQQLNLDLTMFNRCLESRETKNIVEKNFNDGLSLGVDGTPFFFLNNEKISGLISLEEFKLKIDNELNK